MITYKKILFPIDPSETWEKVLPHVKSVVDQFKAELTIAYVAKADESYSENESKPGQVIKTTDKIKQFWNQDRSSQGDVEVVVLEGKPESALIEYIEKAGIDMVVMTSSRRTPLGKVIFGSVAGHMAKNAPVPVFFLNKDNRMITYKKILFPIDLSETCEKVVPHVNSVVDQFEAELTMVYVAKEGEYYSENESKPGQVIKTTDKVKQFWNQHRSSLGDMEVIVLEGKPESALIEYIEKAGIDMVVMASSRRTPLGKVIFGSVAGYMAKNAPVPVFYINPVLDKFINHP
jgi:nucleotide-binding universal stress UspA family protein